MGFCVPFGFILAPAEWFHRSPTATLAHTLIRQLVQGHLNGNHTKPQVQARFETAQPGDIILCHNPHGAYGYWTHAVLYVGGKQVVDSDDFARGTILQDVQHYRNYDEVMLLRPSVPKKLRQEVSEIARAQVGTPYDPLAPLWDTRSLYCSKLIWEDYSKIGVQLCEGSPWIVPDQLAASSRLIRIADWNS